jgi:hypothetical protein
MPALFSGIEGKAMVGMGIGRRAILGGAAVLAAPRLGNAQAGEPLKIGEINSYTAQPAFLQPYRQACHAPAKALRCAASARGIPHPGRSCTHLLHRSSQPGGNTRLLLPGITGMRALPA